MARDGNARGVEAAGAREHNEADAIVAQRRAHATERRRGRELSDAAVLDQARALADYVSRGGSASRWLDSKDFSSADRGRVLVAIHDLADEAAGTAS